ncbi:telomere-associated protein RIF1 isoform X2 [Sceloporus undulatus]|uniref:telomere-associated protein RIF1 isoform X2 n=1 Tax=Sceloporus undulatus TaxID=8520 RepID=UPI001C4A9225|nr:telomere-associated protein RIF1 isoform X2 [Sceloporus undulatus]
MSGADSTTSNAAAAAAASEEESGPGPRLQPLLETLEDPAASPEALTDAFLALTNRLTGEEGKEFAAQVGKYFPQLCKIFKTHIPTENSELSSAALQALGFCVFNSKIASLLCETEIQELLSVVNSVAVKAVDKNTRTRALWVISKQCFPADIIGKLVPSIITVLETVLNKGDLHSMVVEYEALNVIIRLIEQAPSPMEEEAVRWAKLIIPLVVHSAHKVQLRGATALEMGVPLLLQKQPEVAAITEELMTTKIIPELQKLFSSKNETYVLKLWPLFVKLLGKALHRSGSFINSLLQLEELGFRSGSPVVKKIAFIAWKSLIDNFALNPEILCSAKRLKLLMQPLSSIHVRTEALALTKLEVWWYLLMRLGPQLPAHFEQVCVPLIQSTLSIDSSFLQGNSSRLSINQSLLTPGSAQKSGNAACPRLKLNSSIGGVMAIPSIQLLGIEMLLHFFMGPEVLNFAKDNSIVLSLEPLQYSVISSPSFFCKHASTFINAVQDGFIAVGKDASDIILSTIWRKMIDFVRAAIESGSKKERQSSEILTMLLQALKNTVLSNELPVLMSLSLIEITIKELPPKVLGSPAYQVANMDLLNGTPALFLIQLSFREDLLKCCVQEERFFLNYESLVGFVLSGPTSPLAFSESVFTIVNQSAQYLENKEHLWRIWSTVVNPLTEWINQTNEVNQGDALEHNFSAIYSALLLPIKHIFPYSEFPQPTLKTLLRSWSELYRAFARCALLVATAEDNLCCEELCAKIISGIEDETQINQSMLDGLSHITSVMVDCINFAPYGTKYQPSNRSPQTPTDWSKKKKDDPLGKLSSLVKLLMMLVTTLHMLASKESGLEKLAPVGASVIGTLQNIIGHISLPSVIRPLFRIVTKPLAVFYEKTKSTNVSRVTNGLNNKLEKMLVESISCLQSHYTEAFDSELLQELSPMLCIMLSSKSKQIRTQAAQFWNATFGKAIMLTYPEELKSVLCQARQKTILSLPAFESIEMVGECIGTYSDSTENSQWDTVISGIEVNPSGKRDSLLAQTNELKENSIPHVTPAKMKLEFPQLKTNRKNMLLEEENTVDFVFIPPETKERVLTEHQKEVLRTKRVDIPTMYNNLDASQDTALFSQDSQSQEDSVDKATSVDAKEEHGNKENITVSQDEKVASDLPVIPCTEVTEKCNTDVLPEKTALTTDEQHDKKSLESNCKESEIGANKTVSGEPDVSLSENTSDVSNMSSASSDVISGTPQPVSRRQSFITLEKFDSSDVRPFSPSSFSNTSGPSGSIPLSAKQESMVSSNGSSKGKSAVENNDSVKVKKEEGRIRTKRSCLEIIDALENYVKVKKAKDENTLNSKLLSESTVGIKRSSLRQNKTELSEEKKTKLAHPDEEKIIAVAVTTQVEEKHELLGEAQEAGYLVDIQSQASSLTVTGDIKTEIKQTLDNVAETKTGLNVDSKENTPPVIDVSGETISNVSQTTQTSPNQKPLRRSLRRKSETIEGSVDSQDKEHSQQKKDGHKDDEKLLLMKAPQVKETVSHKQKSVPEKTIDTQRGIHESNAIEGIITDECHTSRNSQEEGSKSTRKSEGNNSASDINDLQDSAPDAAAEKAKEPPRYHTRRASQGLLTSIENSESDNSEVREEGTKRKKSGRLKNKISSLGNHVKEDLESQDVHSQGPVEIQKVLVENKEMILSESHMSIPLVSDNSEEGDKNTFQGRDHLEHKENMDIPLYRETSHPEKISDKMLTETSLESKQGTRILDTDSVASCSTSNITDISGDNAHGTVVASGSSEKTEPSECLHKRSKRTRRSKSCDCCDEKSSVQLEQSTADVKKVGTPESKLKEHKKAPSKAAMASPSVQAEESESAERLTVVPCATSTPLLFSKDLADLKDSRRDIESDGHLPEVEVPKEEPKNLPCVKSDRPVTDSLGCVDLAEEASGPSSADSHSKESITQCPSEVDTDPDAEKKVVTNQSDELEEAGMDVDQPEEKPSSETVINVVQNAVEEATVACITVLPEPQETEVGQEENAESVIADTSVGYQTSDLVQKDRSNTDSPLRSKELDALSLAKMSESPNGVQARCVWSPSASPSTSILKRGVKRQQEEDSPSPANKNRRVSFANPIYQEELADDIDRRSPVVRIHSCNGSQSFQSVKPSPSSQAKIAEMVKEPLPAPTESIYPALVGCKAPVDTILPQITSNIWARGLGQLIRAKNIRTVGDLSSLSAAEIKTLPIRSPKVSNVRRALKGYHEQQIKSHGLEETADQDDTEKSVNGTDEKAFSMSDDKAVAGEPVALRADDQSTVDLWAQINTLAAQMTSENLLRYSGNELFEMQEKLHSMTNCIMKNLQSRWKSSSQESTV